MAASAPDLAHLQRLAPVLAPGLGRVRAVQPLSGGASQNLWLIAFGDGAQVVLRRAPEGQPRSALAIPIELEAELIAAAHAAGAPSPRVLHVLSPDDGLGAGFFMEHVAGEALGQRIVRDKAFAAVRPRLAAQCGDILARIHALSPPSGLPVVGPAETIDALEAQHRAEDWPRPVFELAFRWLREHLPPPIPPTVVHGDFRTGNLLIDAQGVCAVLDWELAHAGDPHEDLGWICVNSWRFGRIDQPAGGLGRREDLYAAYERVSGRAVDRARARFWEIAGTLRWGVICTLSAVALREGVRGGVERPMIARRASETELDLINLIEGP